MIKISHAVIVNFLSLTLITGYFNNINNDLHNELFELRLGKTADNGEFWDIQEFNVTVTMYNPTRGQTDKTPNELADGTKINPKKASSYRYIALSRDLLKRWGGPFDYGDYVIIKGAGKDDGVYQVKDTMNSRFTNRVDILKTQGSQIFKYSDVTLYKYKLSDVNGILLTDSNI